MPLITRIADLCAGWNALYSDSTVVSTIVTTVHVLGLLAAGGLAIAADRMTLRATAADASRVAAELHSVHRPVLFALGALFVSGAALAAADVETFLVSPLFWIKMGLVTLLLLNGLGLAQAEARWRRSPEPQPIPWRRLRTHAWASLALWGATTVAGTVLVSAA